MSNNNHRDYDEMPVPPYEVFAFESEVVSEPDDLTPQFQTQRVCRDMDAVLENYVHIDDELKWAKEREGGGRAAVDALYDAGLEDYTFF